MVSKSKLQYLKSLQQKKHREKEGVFLVEGWRTVGEACSALNELQMLVYTKEAKADRRYSSVFLSAQKKSKEYLEASPKEFASFADAVAAQGVAAVVKKSFFDLDREIEKLEKSERGFVAVLDQISDPGNMGAIIRSSDWLGLSAVLLSENCVELYNPKVVRSTAGSIFHLPIIEYPESADRFAELLRRLQKSGFTLFGADVSGDTDLRSLQWPKKSALAIGNEAHGISSEILKILDKRIAVPKFGRAESLNAGVAAGIFFAHRSFQQ